MAVLVEERPTTQIREADRLFDPGWQALDDRVTSVWEGLDDFGSGDVECLVCGGSMGWNRAADTACCDACGSELS